METSSALSRTIARARIATSIFFLLFGEYKVAGPGFAHDGFQTYLHDYIAIGAVSFYRPLLSTVVFPHAVFFGYLVGVELLIGVSLLIGLWVRPAAVLGILFLINSLCLVGTGPRSAIVSPFRRAAGYFAVDLATYHFFTADAGRVWGLDGRRRRLSRIVAVSIEGRDIS
jgi:uncharacterized membrane protein YphA (DoxX/SURF4 family)